MSCVCVCVCSVQYHVFEMSRPLPHFSMYSLLTSDQLAGIAEPPQGHVTFHVKERVNRVSIHPPISLSLSLSEACIPGSQAGICLGFDTHKHTHPFNGPLSRLPR